MKPPQPANLSSHWTIALGDRLFGVLLVGVLALQYFLTIQLPPTADELYYWTWSQNLKGGYFDHPPMVSWLIALSTKLFGDNLFGIRFFTPLVCFYILRSLGKMNRNKFVVHFVVFTPLIVLGGILMTPDTGLLLFWTAYLVWMRRCCSLLSQWEADPVTRVYQKSPVPMRSWIWGGLLLGLGILSKYTMLLAIPCTLVLFLVRFRFPAWTFGFFLHIAVAIAVAFPNLKYLVATDFASFIFQWEHAMGHGGWSIQRLFSVIGGQVLLVGALPFLLFPWILLQPRSLREDPGLGANFYFFFLPAIFFTYKGLTTYTEANWPIVTYLAFWALAQRQLEATSFEGVLKFFIMICFAIPIAATGALFIHWYSPLNIIPPHRDRLHRLIAEESLYKTVATEAPKSDAPLFVKTYQVLSHMRFNGRRAEQEPYQSRRSEYTQVLDDPCRYKEAYFFGPQQMDNRCFNKIEVIKHYPLLVRGQVVEQNTLWRYSNERTADPESGEQDSPDSNSEDTNSSS